ncbi:MULTISPECIES: hypothetical protein [Kitasatospora]|uniref:Integral membrane protein n=1 Tax=Kitasatospora cathayae TaxID=3004092 RepID=A0ABY7Q644_9ACTN|nr:hypothetical protein [Kitasatospora sp. HUAS 3-15]WBP88133.1 hypothetical protein O1G21_21400 [Kitasatospora sp. HUAS 3-15]
MEDEYVRRLKEYYDGRMLIGKVLGGLAVAGWLWALWLVFVPVDGGCGSPAFYEPPKRSVSEYCNAQEIGRIGGAVGVVLATLPVGLGCAWVLTRIRAAQR